VQSVEVAAVFGPLVERFGLVHVMSAGFEEIHETEPPGTTPPEPMTTAVNESDVPE
jgi:hypothetical protein